MSKLNVVYTLNDLYAPIGGVSLESLLFNNKSFDEINIYLLADHLTPENITKFYKTVSKYGRNISIITHETVDKIAEKYHEKYGKGGVYYVDGQPTYVTYYRLCIPECIPEDIERVLYIGCDTLIVGDLKDLFEMDMQGYIVGACADAMNYYYRRRIGLSETDTYYNDDVLLIDVKQWKDCRISDNIFRSAADNQTLFLFQQQDGLNEAIKGKILRLPMQYNMLAPYFIYEYKTVKISNRFNSLNFYSKEEFEKAAENPVICHFSGNALGRPWFKNSKHPMKTVYDKYYFSSLWKDTPQKKRKMEIHYKIQAWSFWHFPKCINSILGICMYRFFSLRYKKK